MLNTVEINKLIDICNKDIYDLSEKYDVVIGKPYIPYIPKNWNGCLVLAEAQNLTNKYIENLKNMIDTEKITRLRGTDLGIMPWDDGSLKIALKTTFNIEPETTAVSNAVLWSQTTNKGNKNKNPSKLLQKESVKIWDNLLEVLQPSILVTSGAIARDVINKTQWIKVSKCKVYFTIHPSAMRYRKSDKSLDELLLSHPNIAQFITDNKEYSPEKALVNFACHVYDEFNKVK